MSEWQPIDSAPEDKWIVGKLEGNARAPAFVGKKYDERFPRDSGEPRLALIDEWTGRWKLVSAWMPLPDGWTYDVKEEG